jgi:hypothetical protein
MKRFISTEFFLSLKEASQKGIDVDAKVLEDSSDEFVMLLLHNPALLQDKVAYRNTLINIRVALAGLTEVSGKKCSNLSAQCA